MKVLLLISRLETFKCRRSFYVTSGSYKSFTIIYV